MINHFQRIKKVGCYDEFTFDSTQLKSFEKVNVLYGNNGCGKTTFSNIMFLLSKHCKDKATLHAELLDKDSELDIVTTTGKVSEKSIISSNLDLYVFNSKFVADHVYNGTIANIDSFSSDVKISSPEIEEIDKKLLRLNSKLSKISEWDSYIEEKLNLTFKNYNDEFQKVVSGYRLTNVKPTTTQFQKGNLSKLKSELNDLYKEYTNKSKETNTIEKLNSIKNRVETIFNIEADLDSLSSKLANKVSIEAKNKIAERIDKYKIIVEDKKQQNSIGDLNDWFKKGGRLLYLSQGNGDNCPLCNAELTNSIQDIITDYASFFSDSLLKLYELIDVNHRALEPFVAGKQIFNNISLIDSVIDQFKTLTNIEIDYPVLLKQSELEQGLKEIVKNLQKKKQAPEVEINLKQESVELIKSYITVIDTFKTVVKEKVDEEIKRLQETSVETLVKTIKSKIGIITSVELNERTNNVLPSRNKSNSAISLKCKKLVADLQKYIVELKALRVEEVSKLNAETKYINLYLKHFGINHFEIDRDKVKTQDNLVITYKTGKRKTKLNHSLSEGEKTALAFAYCISKLRVEKVEGTETGFQNCIIVIDDPISSLDDNRIFQTANIIDSFFFFNTGELNHSPDQLFILSHNLTFIKYLHNALSSNESIKNHINEFYITSQSPRIRRLPAGLKNFTNTYLIKLKDIIDFKENRLEYDNVKNYLPNYIRIVLETFLSFKLAMVNDSHGRLPGLSHLINGMVKEFNLIEDVTIDSINKDGAIKRLNYLKKIADHESHGSIYRAEEFAFISEAELKLFAKNTLQVISYIDNLHFKKVKNLTEMPLSLN